MGLNTETRTTNAAKNVFSAFFSKFVLLLLTFVGRKFFIQYIGVEYLGINGLFTNILTLLAMSELGLWTSMNVCLYRPIADGDTKKIAALMNFFKRIYIGVAISVATIGLILLPFLKYLINMETEIPHIHVYYLMFVLKNIVSYLYIYKSSIIRADQKVYIINHWEMIVSLSKVAVQIISVLVFKNYLIYIIIEIVAVFALNMCVSHEADKRYSFINDDVRLDSSEKKSIMSEVLSMFVYKISWSLMNGTDNVIMSVICGTVTVGLYYNYNTITSNINSVVVLIFTSLTASVGNLVATSAAENKYKTFRTMQMVGFWISGIVCVCMFFLLQDFIYLWLGTEYLLDGLTVVAIVLNLFYSACMYPVWTFREGTGMYRRLRYIMLVAAVLNIILSIALGKWLGVSGILFATFISNMVTSFCYEPNILFKDFFGTRARDFYIDFALNIVLLIATGVICYFTLRFIKEVSIVGWIVKAVICLLVVNVVYLLRYYKTPEFAHIIEKLRSILKKPAR